jgi:hypothetical protein
MSFKIARENISLLIFFLVSILIKSVNLKIGVYVRKLYDTNSLTSLKNRRNMEVEKNEAEGDFLGCCAM